MRKLILASLVFGAGAVAAHAQEQKEEYAPPGGAERETLVQEALPGAEGQQMTIQRITFPPGWTGGRHYHAGPVYVYILEGSFAVEEEGAQQKTFTAGELYEEPVGQTMQARNMSASEPLTILLIQTSGEGEPLLYRAG